MNDVGVYHNGMRKQVSSHVDEMLHIHAYRVKSKQEQ